MKTSFRATLKGLGLTDKQIKYFYNKFRYHYHLSDIKHIDESIVDGNLYINFYMKNDEAVGYPYPFHIG